MNKTRKKRNKNKNNKITPSKITKLQMSNIVRNFYNISNTILEGSKVKLNYNKITNRKDYNNLVPEYKEFIEKNKDRIFTVEYDKDRKNMPIWVCLAEDDTPVKWLFYVGDLKVVELPNNYIS